MNLTLIRSMTRSAVFELENELCYRPAHPFTVALNGKTVYEACNTNVFSLFSLLPGTTYTVEVQAEDETLKLDFTTEAETFFVDAARYGLVADGETDNTVRLQAALSTCPKGGTVYVPAGRYRTASLFMKSNTTLYLEKGAVLLGDNDRTHYPILPGVLPSENEVDEYYLTGWEGNPLDSFAGLLNITQVHDVVVTGEGTLDCDAENGDWWVNPKVKRIAWRPRAVAAVDSENVCLHGITVQNSLNSRFYWDANENQLLYALPETPTVTATADGFQLRAAVTVGVARFCPSEFRQVTGVTVQERVCPYAAVPSLTIVRWNGEDLWQLSKRYCSSERCIRETNGLLDDDAPAELPQYLLIPKTEA